MLLCAIAPAGQAEAATLHAILVADTEDPGIGESVALDIDMMMEEAKLIASQGAAITACPER